MPTETIDNLNDPHDPPAETMEDDPGCSIEVDVFIEGESFPGYYCEGAWWIDYGGITIGHRKTYCDDIDGWKYKTE